MSEALRIMRAHLARGGAQGPHTAIGQGAWQTLKDRGWDPRQITALIPHLGMEVGDWTTNKMATFPNAASNIGVSGLWNLSTAQKWVGQGMDQNQIAAHGRQLGGTPRGKQTSRSGWQAGFTPEAASWLNNKWNQDAAEANAAALEDAKLREEAPEEDPKWATDLSQTLTDLTKQINEPAVTPTEMGGYSTPSYVGKGGTTSLKIDKPKRGSRDKGTRRFRRSSFSMPTTNTASGKASNNSAVNV